MKGLATEESNPQIARDLRPFFVGWFLYVVVALLLGCAGLRTMSQSFDFRNFYTAGYLMRSSPSQLYDLQRQQQLQSALISPNPLALPFVHPSYEALLYAPFSLLSYGDAYLCYLLFNLLILAALFLYGYPLFAAYIPLWQPRPGLMLYPYLPLLVAFWHGQNALLFLWICCAVWLQIPKGHEFRAGSLLALGLFKFHVAIPIAILCAVRRSWRFSAGFLGTSAAVIVLCIWLTGGAGFVLFVHHLVTTSLVHDQSQAAQSAILVFPRGMVNLVGLLSPITQHLSAGLAFVTVAGVSIAVMGLGLYLVRIAEDESVAFAIAVLCGMLVSYHLYVSDAALILLPLALLAGRLSRTLLLTTYVLPLVVMLGMGRGWNFLLVAPVVWMLASAAGAARSREAVPEAAVG